VSLREPRKDRETNRTSFVKRTARTGNLTASHRRAPKQEREVAERLGGRRTSASGAKDVKGDVRIRGIARIECKTTKHKSFSVSLAMLEKLEENALLTGEVPAIIIEFNDNDGRKRGEVAVVPTYVLDGLKA
jgi:hypothetical protein